MPEPDWSGPLNDFLKSIMIARYGSAEGKLGQQKLALEQQKLSMEQANHAADMKQRADQFGQELKLRQQEADASDAFRKATLAQGEAARKDASQERFRAAGGELFPAANPDLTRTDTLAGPTLQVPQVPAGPSAPAPTQPVGPTLPDELGAIASGRNVVAPPAMVPTSLSSTVPVPLAAQRPDPERYRPTVAPLGTPDNQEAYFPTLKGKALETKEAENEANQMEWTPELAKALPEYGLEPGAKIDRRQLPLIEKHLDFMLAQKNHEADFAATMAQRKQAEQDGNFIKLLALQIKEQGEGGADTALNWEKGLLASPDNGDMIKDGKMRSQVNNLLAKETDENGNPLGLSYPKPLNQALASQQSAAKQTQAQATTLLQQLKDPTIQPYLGKIKGSITNYSLSELGGLGIPPEIQEKLARIQKNFTNLQITTAKESMPGRMIGSIFNFMQKSSAGMDQQMPVILGHIRGALDNSRFVQESIEAKHGANWEKRKEFQQNLPERQLDVTDQIGAERLAKMPLNTEITTKNGDRYIKMEVTRGLDDSGNEVGTNVRVYKVRD